MTNIPVSFDHKGKKYEGYFSAVFGAGQANVWYLMIENFYNGRLRYTEKDEWFFDPVPSPDFSEHTNYFSLVVIAAYQ